MKIYRKTIYEIGKKIMNIYRNIKDRSVLCDRFIQGYIRCFLAHLSDIRINGVEIKSTL